MKDRSKIILRWEIDNATARFATGRVESEVFYKGGFKWWADTEYFGTILVHWNVSKGSQSIKGISVSGSNTYAISSENIFCYHEAFAGRFLQKKNPMGTGRISLWDAMRVTMELGSVMLKSTWSIMIRTGETTQAAPRFNTMLLFILF